MRGPGVFRVIHPMSKAGNLLFLRQHIAHVRYRIGFFAVDRLKNPEHRFIGPAVQRALQGANRRRDRECMSESVAAVTRAAKVDAFNS